MGTRACVVAVAIGISSLILTGCQTTATRSEAPSQSTQVSEATSHVTTNSSYLEGARSHYTVAMASDGGSRLHTATWIVPDAYRGEVIFGEQTSPDLYFKAFDVKAEMLAYRYFGKELTEEIQWGERRRHATMLAPLDVIDFIAIGTDSKVDRCSGFLGYWDDRNKRLSGFICDRTGYEGDYPKAEDFLPTISVRGEAEGVVAR